FLRGYASSWAAHEIRDWRLRSGQPCHHRQTGRVQCSNFVLICIFESAPHGSHVRPLRSHGYLPVWLVWQTWCRQRTWVRLWLRFRCAAFFVGRLASCSVTISPSALRRQGRLRGTPASPPPLGMGVMQLEEV